MLAFYQENMQQIISDKDLYECKDENYLEVKRLLGQNKIRHFVMI